MIVSVQADRRLMAQLDREAKARGMSRSEAIRLAIEKWTAEAVEEDQDRVSRAEERHRQLMRRLEYVIGMIREQEKDQRARANGAATANNTIAPGGSGEGALGRALGAAAGEGEEAR